MSSREERLWRLAGAQAKRAGLIEMQLAQHNVKSESVRRMIDGMSASISALEAWHLLFRASALARLAEAEAILAVNRTETETIRRDLAAARGREKVFRTKAALLRSVAERKALEEDVLENAMHMAAKASGKAGVLK